MLYGNNIDTKTFGSGFPLSGSSESCKYKTSGWNLNNTAKLPGSLLTFDDCESVCVPRLSVGMCLSSQLWVSFNVHVKLCCHFLSEIASILQAITILFSQCSKSRSRRQIGSKRNEFSKTIKKKKGKSV